MARARPKLKIGVFDSGIGGLSVVKAIKRALPNVEVIFRNDSEHVPYGNKTADEIYKLTKPVLQNLLADGCRVIVVACNTVTTNLIERLREELPVPLIGMEPMIKPAAVSTKSGIIAVCATPRTLLSARYHWLKEQYADHVKVLEPDCSDWSYMIENNQLDREKIAKTINEVCHQGADQIVLGCTHYHWIEQLIKDLSEGRAQVIQPEVATVGQLKRVLEQLA